MRGLVVKRSVVAALAGAALIVPVSAAVADDTRIPGLCYVLSGGGWLGAPCVDGLEPYFPDTAPPVVTYGGADRYETAALFSAAEFAPGVPTVYVVNGQTFVDALAAGAATDGPVLLVPPTGDLPATVASELARLDPGRVVVLGRGVTDAVVTQVRAAATR